jgi:N-acetylneuraminate synthase
LIIERRIPDFVVFSHDPVSRALQKISENKSGLVFAVAHNGVLEGVLTDGDFRRWMLRSEEIDLSLPVALVMNEHYTVFPEDTAAADIAAALSERIDFIPLVDRQGRLVAVASESPKDVRIGRFVLADKNPSFLVAEIGNNHNGSLDLAFKLIDAAAESGADCAKFQMRNLKDLYETADATRPSEDLGAQYTLDLLARFQLSAEHMFRAFDHCKERGILPLCTPWDKSSLFALEQYGMPAYKVASADLTNPELLEALCKLRKPLLCSTGMSSESEIRQAVSLLKSNAAQFVLLHCNSTYPAPFKDINLSYMDRLREMGGGCLVGYSGHERGYAVPVAAVARGARVIEKHFTLDRNMEGNDHRVSLLPGEFAEMVKSIREVEQSLGSAEARRITQGELMNREILGKSLQAARDIRAGERIVASHLQIRSPGKGLAPYRRSELIGRLCPRDMLAGDLFFPSDVTSTVATPRTYSFDRPFGVPVRYHDMDGMLSRSNIDLVEFHLSYKDMDLDPADLLRRETYSQQLVVHSPELFAADHIMDLGADDEQYRARSIAELQRVIEVVRRLKLFFPDTKRPYLIINAGGFSLDGFISRAGRVGKYDLVASALAEIDDDGVEIILQTMPPFPWHFGGQRYHNLFCAAEDIVEFCRRHHKRVCLDVSHSKLACNQAGASFAEFISQVAPYAAHLHIVDAAGVDGEGLQIGDGEIDFVDLAGQLRELCPRASFVPEVWQGHKNAGEGFWKALALLEEKFGGAHRAQAQRITAEVFSTPALPVKG